MSSDFKVGDRVRHIKGTRPGVIVRLAHQSGRYWVKFEGSRPELLRYGRELEPLPAEAPAAESELKAAAAYEAMPVGVDEFSVEAPAAEDNCPFCAGSGDCPEMHPGPAAWICTREGGHSGDHVACGGEHDLARWSDSNPATPDSLESLVATWREIEGNGWSASALPLVMAGDALCAAVERLLAERHDARMWAAETLANRYAATLADRDSEIRVLGNTLEAASKSLADRDREIEKLRGRLLARSSDT